MGQYYKAYIQNNDKVYVFDSWSHDNGAKLMEHSWMGNYFVDAAYTVIDRNPSKVGWIGDYSIDVGCDEEIYKTCWGEDAREDHVEVNRFFKSGDETEVEGFLINHTKKQYVDLAKYADLAADKYDWVTNPLPLLTAIGNGLGGGDYHREGCTNMEMVGYWYMDVIEFDMDSHPDYTDITEDVIFVEP